MADELTPKELKEIDLKLQRKIIDFYIDNKKVIPDKSIEVIKQEVIKLFKHKKNNIKYDRTIKIGKLYLYLSSVGWRYDISILNNFKDKNKLNKYISDGILYDDIEQLLKGEQHKEFKTLFEEDIDGKDINDIKTSINKYRVRINKYYPVPENLAFISYDSIYFKEFFKLFNEPEKEKILFIRQAGKKINNSYISTKTYLVLDVVEGLNQIRFALIMDLDGIMSIGVFNTNSTIYNYIDKDRLIYVYNSYNNEIRYWIAFEINDTIEKMNTKIIDYISYLKRCEITGRYDNGYVTDDMVLTVKARFALQEQKEKREKEIAMMKNKKYEEKLENMNTKPLIKNNISFYEHKMIYEGIILDTNKLFDFRKYLKSRKIDDIADFNTIYNGVVSSIANKFVSQYDDNRVDYNIHSNGFWSCVSTKKDLIRMSIAGKPISISKQGTFYFINNIRINKKEIAECLTHILCYSKLDDYKKFLTSVSKCSLKFHKVITNGIKKTTYNSGQNSVMEFKIKRIKNLNYIVLNKKNYKISDTNRLIDAENNGSMRNLIYVLLEVTELTLKDIKPLFKEAIDRYKKALEKSEKLLKETLDKFKVKKKTIDGKDGYVVNGTSGNKYLIDVQGNDAHTTYKVWQIIGNRLDYRCIVDTSAKNQTGKDALVSRIYALANDSFFANDISTLRV